MSQLSTEEKKMMGMANTATTNNNNNSSTSPLKKTTGVSNVNSASLSVSKNNNVTKSSDGAEFATVENVDLFLSQNFEKKSEKSFAELKNFLTWEEPQILGKSEKPKIFFGVFIENSIKFCEEKRMEHLSDAIFLHLMSSGKK
jgi:hypothetical protein